MPSQPPILQSSPGDGYFACKADIDAAVARVLESRWYILGEEVKAFEAEFAAYTGTAHAAGVGSGTDALQVALRALGVGQGDLVFTVSHTAVATVAAIALVGATPVYVDIDPTTFVMTAATLEAGLAAAPAGTPRVVIPVHLYGHPVAMPALLEVTRRHGLRVIEDCAQSHGATVGGRQTGAWGDLAAFSFYPTKNLGALGDGGAVVTNDAALDQEVRLIREYGWKERYVSHIAGTNSRLDELQAAILRARLPHLDADNDSRRRIAAYYDAHCQSPALELPLAAPGVGHVYHQYVVRSGERDALQQHLRAAGIGSQIHYPVPVHLQPAYAHFSTAPLPHTERAAREVLSLPIYPQLPHGALERVRRAIIGFQPGHQ